MAKLPFKSISVILSPYHCGTRGIGPGAGPLFLQSRGLLPMLKEFGLPVREFELEPVDELDGEVARSFELFRKTSNLVAQERSDGSFPIILSGNCSGAVGVAAGLTSSKTVTGADLGCIWFDAHDDFHIPDTLTSGYGDSMPISLLAGICYQRMLQSVPGHQPLDLKNLVHIGMRDVTEEEKQRVVDAGFDVIWGNEEEKVDFAGGLTQSLQRKKLGETMVHVDLDSLDASIGKANKFATAGGLLEDDLTRCLEQAVSLTEPASLTLASFDPGFEGAQNIADVAIRGVKTFLQALLR